MPRDLGAFQELLRSLPSLSSAEFQSNKAHFLRSFAHSPLISDLSHLDGIFEYNRTPDKLRDILATKHPAQVIAFLNWSKRNLSNLHSSAAILQTVPLTHPREVVLIEPYKQLLFDVIRRQRNWISIYTTKNRKAPALELAWYLYKIGYYSQAEILLKDKSLKNINKYYYLGVIKYKRQNYKEAEIFLGKYLSQKPRFNPTPSTIAHWARYYFFLTLEKRGKYQRLIPELKAFCRKYPVERYYRILLRVVSRTRDRSVAEIKKRFFNRFPNSYTTYLEKRREAFNQLEKNVNKGLFLLRDA